ncbi:MAG TPA: DNA polymerase III subunit gamma/tau [Candidatus Saccharimonadales bacterium]|nr:DNA polymerase III subunit gamma/tau [Candidatus Saccharimonadales bacterium]
MSKALYRKYRSKTLGEIVGQNHVTDVLSRALKQGKIAHAYLLTGPRGVGKTSIARILAHEINGLKYGDSSTYLDIIEIDAASNNGVEDVRDLREKVQIAPVSAAKKVYIIDEVHMLSKAAFNALLKTLEEPPEHAVFILATTDIEKLPATIISRAQRFHFRAITPVDAIKHLRYIANQEKIIITDEALTLIAERGDGSFRDSISLLDQLSSLSDDKEGITRELVEQALGIAPAAHVQKILEAYQAKNLESIVALLNDAENSGIQPGVLTSQLITAIRADIASNPQLLPLLDKLLEVNRSSHPTVKLLVALAEAAQPPKVKSAALSAPAPVISAPVAVIKKLPAKPAQEKPAESTTITPSRKKTAPKGEVDWTKVLEYAKEHYLAMYSVLSKCSYELDGDLLRIYTVNAFYKKKLDDPKYRINIAQSLIETGAGDWEIETVPTPPPPKDSQAAAVAAIMGGGEEVNVEA